ncbi:MAG: hypothetical protein LM590_10935 [Thermofilum sp.]|nr:hypothetical protein [Thermofilum sp.]
MGRSIILIVVNVNKGISSINATLLLIFIATVAVMLIWFWLPSLRTESRGSIGVLLKIEAVSVSSNSLTLYVRNIGNEEIKIDKVSIEDPVTGLSKYIVDVGPMTLKPDQLATVNVPLPPSIQSGKYTLRVLSTSGISIATYAVDISSVSQQPLQLPLFKIVSYNSTIVGAPSSIKSLVVGIVNDGSASGVAIVRVLDSSGNIASSASVSLSPGQRTNVTLSVVLPQATDKYQWRIVAINNATGRQDDEKTFTVSVLGELIKNGDFSQGSAYWTLEEPWSVDTSLQLARINLTNTGDISASLSQSFTLSSAVTLTQLNLWYYMYAHPPGQVNSLQLVISIESDSTTLWSGTISWKTSEEPTKGNYAAQLSLQLVPGTYTLRIKALLDVKQKLDQLDIRVDNVSLLYAP